MAESTLPEARADTLRRALETATADRPAPPRATVGAPATGVPAPATAATAGDRGHASPARTAIDRIEEHLDAIDSRLRTLEDRFDDMVAELRALGSDVTDQTNRQQHNATKEWITWAVVTILVVILGAMWWAFKIYILPSHHQVM